MAQCKQTSQEFIKNAFTPQIAVLCTPLAEKCCQKNNLNFIELLQPFSKLSTDVHYKDPTGVMITIRNLKLTFLDVNSRPPQTTLARKYLNSSVSELSDFRTESFTTSERLLNITMTTSWFESWRDTFLRVQYPSDHEYTKHFLSCVLVVSSGEINVVESVIQLAQNLNQMQNNGPGKLPKWFSSNVLKYYVIIHDNIEGNIDIANEAYESVKSCYGEPNCFLLRMNSRPPGAASSEHLPDPWSQFINNNIESRDLKPTPDNSPYTSRAVFDTMQENETKTNLDYHPLSPNTEELIMNTSINEKDKFTPNNVKLKSHGLCLSTEDIEQVKLFLHEFSKTCLLPYIEKQIQQLNDVISNKKGVSRSLFSATKRWFNPNKPGASSSVVMNNLIYAPDSPELQVRRLGDLYFMFGHFSNAFQAYHLAKRDYNTDQAWLYYAGALEMAALAAFMANESNRKTFDYMEESITTYLNTCKMPQFATRATLLSLECLKSRGLYGEAAHQLIRMTSEESDLRSALFLEQAAYCFLHSKMIRKYAFHMVLAGHRFSKAAQRKHSLRSYKQAHQIYEGTGWDLAEDHIHYTIGRQAHNLHSFDEAVASFARLLNGDSKQTGQQQSIFLKEYLTILGNKLLKEQNDDVPVLALPKLDNDSLKLLMEPTPPLTTPGKVSAVGLNFSQDSQDSVTRWNRLEELLVQEASGTIPMTFKPMISLYSVQNLVKTNPTAIVNEPIQVCVHLVNSLQIILQLKDIFLLWSFKSPTEMVSNENDTNEKYIKTHVTKSVLVQANSNQNIVLAVTPLITGIVTLKGICYTLASSSTPSDNIFIKGKQLFGSEIEIKIVPLAPCLQVTFSELNLEFLCDEVQKVTIDFQNVGTLPLHKVYLATSVPQYLSIGKDFEPEMNFSQCTPSVREKMIRENHVSSLVLPNNNRLDLGQTTSLNVFIKAPNKPGSCVIDLLIYYENVESGVVPRYRLVRHKWTLSVQESVKVEATAQKSYNCKDSEEIAVVLTTSNLNKLYNSTLTEISLLNIGMLSKFWKLTQNIVTPKYINLRSQESAHILLKARRINERKSVYSNIYLNRERSTRENLNTAYLSFAKKTEHINEINLFEDEEEQEKEEEEVEQGEKFSSEGSVFVQWQALVNDPQKRIVNGQSQISVQVYNKTNKSVDLDDFATLNVADSTISLKDKVVNQNKVTCTLLYPSLIEHNFGKDKLCIVPVTLLVHSIVSENLNVTINTLGAGSSSLLSDLFYPNASKHFSWLGTASAIRNLEPFATERIPLSAVVSKPGTFDLGSRIEVYCTNEIDQAAVVLQNSQIQSAVIVVDGS